MVNIKNIFINGVFNETNNFSFSTNIYIPFSVSTMKVKTFSFIALSDIGDLPPISFINSTIVSSPIIHFSRATNGEFVPNIKHQLVNNIIQGDYIFNLFSTPFIIPADTCEIAIALILEFS